MTRFHVFSSIAALAFAGIAGCAEVDTVSDNQSGLTWDEFRAMVYDEPDTDVFVYNGDETIVGEENLRKFYDTNFANTGELIVHQAGGSDAKWPNGHQITYCVSTSFNSSSNGNRYQDAVDAMNQASAMWEASGGDFDLVHVSSQDGNCTANNNNVEFDVRPTNSGGQYLARAFFPDQSRSTRNVLIDWSTWTSSWAAVDIVAHEIGHALGFRHEHTRPESGTCFEDNNWRALTAYDRDSIMHYPQCNGNPNNELKIRQSDRDGANALYSGGSSGPVCGDGVCEAGEDENSCSADCGSEPPPPTGSCPAGWSSVTGSLSGSGDSKSYTYSTFNGLHQFELMGPSSADFDLYLYRGSRQRASSTSAGSNESISYSGRANKITVTSYSGSGAYTLCYNL